MNVFDDATVHEIEVLQNLIDGNLPEAIAAMTSVTDIRAYLWRAWVAARHNGHPNVTLNDIRALPYLQLLEATAEGVTDADPAT